ncbi:nickel ABC transporter substrate-binding protein [Klebsiella pneumoniae]|nr:nickel ABC transporter substrate-binding protein [Klebsiella pneumoniae]
MSLLAQAAPYQLTTAWPVNVGPLNPLTPIRPTRCLPKAWSMNRQKYQADGSVQPSLATRWLPADGKTCGPPCATHVASNGEPPNAQRGGQFSGGAGQPPTPRLAELANRGHRTRALSATELQITLKSAYAPLLQELALPRPGSASIAPAIDGGTARHKAPIGTGPWRLASPQLNQRDVLVRNERYWGRKPALQQITIKVIPDATSRAVAFETGEIDMLYGDEGLLPLDTFERFRHHPGYVARLSAPAETVMLALNASQGPTREQAVREALNYAVDKQTLVDSVLYGTQQVADTLFAPSVPYAPQDLTPRRYDPTKARALLEQAGWQQLEGQPWRQKAGQPLAIELAFIGTDALAKSMAEIIQANLRQVGVQVTLVGEEESSIYARQREGRFGMIFNRTWGAPYDPHAFLSSMRVPSHADYQAQRGLPDKALIDKEISEVLTTGDEAQRRKLYHDVLTRLHQDAVYLPISYVSLMSVARQEVGEIPFAPVTSEIPFDQITPVTP